jgi:hypothetical protein
MLLGCALAQTVRQARGGCPGFGNDYVMKDSSDTERSHLGVGTVLLTTQLSTSFLAAWTSHVMLVHNFLS